MKKKIIYILLISVLLISAVMVVISEFSEKTPMEETTGDVETKETSQQTEEQTTLDVPEETTEDNTVAEIPEYELIIPDIQSIIGEERGIFATVMDIAVFNERIYAVAKIVGMEQGIKAYKLVSFKPDGSDIQSVELEEPSVKMNDDMAEEVLIGQDGNIYAVRNYNPSVSWSLWYTGDIHLLSWGTDGTLISETALEVPDIDEDKSVQIWTFNVTKEGNIALLCCSTEGHGSVIHLGKDGSIDEWIEMAQDESYTSWWNANDGTFVSYYGEEVGSTHKYNYYYKTYDIDSRMFSEKVRVLIPGKMDEYNQIFGKCTGRNILILEKDDCFYRHDVGTEEIRLLVNPSSAGYNNERFRDLILMDDDILVWRYENMFDPHDNRVAVLTPKENTP